MKKFTIKKISLLGTVFIICGLIGVATLHGSAAKDALYQVNENGQTYGQGIYANSEDEFPDLIESEGTNKQIGYVKKIDLFEEMPTTPEEALERQKISNIRYITLYAKDGTTVVGEFKAGGGSEDLESEKMIRDKLAESKESVYFDASK